MASLEITIFRKPIFDPIYTAAGRELADSALWEKRFLKPFSYKENEIVEYYMLNESIHLLEPQALACRYITNENKFYIHYMHVNYFETYNVLAYMSVRTGTFGHDSHKWLLDSKEYLACLSGANNYFMFGLYNKAYYVDFLEKRQQDQFIEFYSKYPSNT